MKKIKMVVPIEEVQQDDFVNGKPVVDVLHRLIASYVRLVLKGGEIVDGYMGKKKVEIERWKAGV